MPANIKFVPVRTTFARLVGNGYAARVCDSRVWLTGEGWARLNALANRPVDYYPEKLQARLEGMLPFTGKTIVQTADLTSAAGATSGEFKAHTNQSCSPLNGFGYFRVGEDGRLYLAMKSEHYHAPLGHSFPGYQLIETARHLGIPNATHNNTRWHITRLLEETLVAEANGIDPTDVSALGTLLNTTDPNIMNRVLNLETGSLAVEAALKMALARFLRVQPSDYHAPIYQGRTPVILVMGNDDGGPQANYHGTTMITQMMRGMWPELRAGIEHHELFRTACVRPNNMNDLGAAFRQYDRWPFKIAAFFHEIVMMNYGAKLLTNDFLQHAYTLCKEHDVPTIVDEIQTGIWAPDLFLFRELGLRPSFAVLGKGFPGGEYPASRLLFSSAFDNLPQFGALVTNGQEELASLAYLITMRWAKANAGPIRQIGDYYEDRLRDFAARYPNQIYKIDGKWHLSSIVFNDLTLAKAFVKKLNDMGMDMSVQTYKADCPPAVLTKLPLIAGPKVIDFVIGRMDEAMRAVRAK